ncbi:hypothetical protein L218DRAFT_992524 [Marasmius fiardii PR-910]|nr:hypothetical protein L218DRAFT_992524 [Marasmius fiardii PR-910]
MSVESSGKGSSKLMSTPGPGVPVAVSVGCRYQRDAAQPWTFFHPMQLLRKTRETMRKDENMGNGEGRWRSVWKNEDCDAEVSSTGACKELCRSFPGLKKLFRTVLGVSWSLNLEKGKEEKRRSTSMPLHLFVLRDSKKIVRDCVNETAVGGEENV